MSAAPSMENCNIQLCWSARDLMCALPLYPVTMVYKRHLGGVATPQYIVPSNLWAWSWGARVGGVPDMLKEGVSGPSIPTNKCGQIN
jgi:hypothetical protein